LRALEAGPPHPDLVTAFLLKFADVVGVSPALDHCAGCGTERDVHRFAFAAGGALCERCRTSGAVVLRAGLTAYLATLAGADLGDLPPSDPTFAGEAQGVVRRFLEFHLDRRLHSLASADA
jgi:DNA repair protein RecO (recombination protein O)